jgi:hypothetical protein
VTLTGSGFTAKASSVKKSVPKQIRNDCLREKLEQHPSLSDFLCASLSCHIGRVRGK